MLVLLFVCLFAAVSGIVQPDQTVQDLETVLTTARKTGAANRHNSSRPIILIPGLAGSRLQYSWTSDAPREGVLCRSEGSLEDAWVRLSAVLPLTAKCVMGRLAMRWNGVEWLDERGVNVSVVPGPEGIAYLDPSDKATRAITKYFGPLIEALQAGGYPMETANYDWRVGCKGLTEWRQRLQAQIEAHDQPVLLVAHSMGCMQTSYFLSTMSPAWRAQHVSSFISAGGPYLGAPKVLKSMISGDNLGIPTLPASDARLLQAHSGASALVSPIPAPAWGLEPLLTAGSDTYFYQNISKVFALLNNSDAYAAEAKTFPGIMSDPGIPVYVVRGTGVKTVVGVGYPKSDFTGSVTEIFGDGDGTVPSISSKYALNWANVVDLPQQDVKHLDLIANSDFYQLVMKLATK